MASTSAVSWIALSPVWSKRSLIGGTADKARRHAARRRKPQEILRRRAHARRGGSPRAPLLARGGGRCEGGGHAPPANRRPHRLDSDARPGLATWIPHV